MKNMREKNKVISAGVGYTIGNYLIKGLVFLTIPIFSRLLSAEDYGIYNLYISYEGIMCHFVGLAIFMSLKNAKIKWDEQQYFSYCSSLILLLMANMALWLSVTCCFSTQLEEIIGFDIFIIQTIVFHSFCSALLTFYNVHVSLDYSYKSYIIIGATNAITNVVLSIIFICMMSSEKYVGRIYGTVIPMCIIAFLVIFFFWKKARPRYNTEYWRYGLKYSIPLVPHALSQVVLNQFDRIMIAKMSGTTESGIYSFGYNIYSIIAVTTSSLDNVWGPWFYKKMKSEDYEDIKKRSLEYVIGVGLFVSCIILIAPEIIKLLGTAEYRESVYVVIPLTVAGFFAFLYTLPAQVEYYYEKTKYIAMGTMLAAALNVVLNFICIPKYGYVAAAYTTAITYILYYALHYMLANRIMKKSLYAGTKIALCSVVVCVIGLIGIQILEMIWLRWLMASAILIMLLVFLVIKLDICSKVKMKRRV